MTTDSTTIRVTRIIARLNVGGPAIQAITLTRRLEPYGYRTRLVRGRERPEEGTMDYLADQYEVVPTLVEAMRRDPGPGDLVALWALLRLLRRDRPQIVHTHAAKAGTLGRVATMIAFPSRSGRPALVHTFHGHSLTGYFSSRSSRLFGSIERVLARHTDVLIAVSAEVRDDLVRLDVAPSAQFVVLPVGFDLAPFIDDYDRPRRREAVRREWGIASADEVVTLVARLVPIKRVDRFLRVANLLAHRPRARFVVVGDGELREQLIASPDARALAGRLRWAGFRRDMPDVYFASDVVVLTSDNEGTPVSLVEAQAAAVPVVAVDVGGVRSVVRDDQTGLVVAVDDESAFARAIESILDDSRLSSRLAQTGRAHAAREFTLERLAQDHHELYRRILRAM